MTASDPMLVPEGAQLSGEAQAQAFDQLMKAEARPMNVVGFGFGVKWTGGQPTGTPALLVFVTQKFPTEVLRDQDLVPSQLDDGTPTDVVSVGHLIAQGYGSQAAQLTDTLDDLTRTPPSARILLGEANALTRRLRPCPAGFSIGNVAVTAGTLGGVVYDFLPGATVNPPAPGIGIPPKFYVLSNNHVLAASNAAPLDSAIVQPGRADGGQDPQDRIATLSRFVPIQFSSQAPLDQQQNVVDCAIGLCQFQDATRETYFNGAPRGWRRRADVAVGDLVRKTGRTTNTSFGRIISVNATVEVGYGAAGVARFQDQIITTSMSAGGDSGSLVTTIDNVVVGLLFAGSSQVTIVNYFENVRAMLHVEIAEQLM
jgi:hypothetical protein